MPEIHEEHPMGLLENVDPNQVQDWTFKINTGKILARPFNTEVHYVPNHLDIAKELMTAIKDIVGLTNVSVAEPTKDPNSGPKDRPPMAFLIYDLSDNDVALLMDRHIWVSQSLTFEISPFPLERPSFLFSIRGLATTSENHIKELILITWKDPISKAFFDKILQNTPPFYQNVTYHEINRFINSIDIKHLEIKTEGGRDDPHFNVYTNSSLLSNAEMWMETQNFLHRRTYRSSILGHGQVILDKFHCHLCHGKDHPKGLCPFPKIPGWKGPKRPIRPESSHPPSENSN
jgi:hypothetical protein